MNTKIFKVIFGIGIFGAGVIFGKQFQKSSHRKRTNVRWNSPGIRKKWYTRIIFGFRGSARDFGRVSGRYI